MLKDKLLQLAFTSNQADVYLALLELGETKVGPIIHKTNFHRNIVYRALDDLIAKKLGSRITKRGVFYYGILNPEPLLNKIKIEEQLAKEVMDEIKSQKKPSPAEVMIFSGIKGLEEIYEMFIEQGENIYLIGANFSFHSAMSQALPILQRVKDKQIEHYAVAQPQARAQKKEILQSVEHLRFLPNNFPPSPLVLWISGHFVSHVLWEQTPVAFLIRNKKIADNYRQYFQLLWKLSKVK